MNKMVYRIKSNGTFKSVSTKIETYLKEMMNPVFRKSKSKGRIIYPRVTNYPKILNNSTGAEIEDNLTLSAGTHNVLIKTKGRFIIEAEGDFPVLININKHSGIGNTVVTITVQSLASNSVTFTVYSMGNSKAFTVSKGIAGK